MTIYERVFANLESRHGLAQQDEINRCCAKLGKSLHDDLTKFLVSYGWGEGFAGDPEKSEYIILYSTSELEANQPEGLPNNLIVIGENGGGEWIVSHSNAGFGLLAMVSNFETVFHHVAPNFEDFLQKSMLGQWF